MRSANEAVRAAAAALAPVSETPRLDAELLMAHALGVGREGLVFRPHEEPAGFAGLVARRLAHEPVAYIVGQRAFWTIELEVGPGVLVPRPDSETLIEAGVAWFGAGAPRRVLDLGTGSGALLLAALDQWPDATGVGVDRSDAALGYARRNGARVAPARVEFRSGTWAEGLNERFDLVLCNPPYVAAAAVLAPQVRAWEPAGALFAGPDGLDDYRRLAPQLGDVLAEGGVACIEVGAGQAEAVMALFFPYGFAAKTRRDLGGHERCVMLHHK